MAGPRRVKRHLARVGTAGSTQRRRSPHRVLLLGCAVPWAVLARDGGPGQARPGLGDSDASERGGGATDKEITFHTKMCLAPRPSNREHTHTVDAKASPTGAGVVPGGRKDFRRQQGRRSTEAANGDPTQRKGPHSIRCLTMICYFYLHRTTQSTLI